MRRTSTGDGIFWIPSVVLYRHDLDEMSALMGSPEDPIVFESSGYEFDTLDEMLCELGGEFTEFRMHSQKRIRSPQFIVSNGTTRIVGRGDDDEKALRLREFLLKRKRVLSLSNPSARHMVAGIALLAGYLGLTVLFDFFGHVRIGIAVAGAMMLFFMFRGSIMWVPGGSLIHLARQHEYQTFWSRHEENIVRAALAVVSGAVGGLIGYWLKK